MPPVTDPGMIPSSNRNIFRVTGLGAGNSPANGEFPSQKPVTRSFDIFFDLRLNKRLIKQSRRRWLETPSSSLWRHWNGARSCFNINMLSCQKRNRHHKDKTVSLTNVLSIWWGSIHLVLILKPGSELNRNPADAATIGPVEIESCSTLVYSFGRQSVPGKESL